MAMVKSENKKLAIIGSGHIATALVSGLLLSKIIPASQIIVSNPSGRGLEKFSKNFTVTTTKNNVKAANQADLIFLCVKPLLIRSVLKQIKKYCLNKLIVSLAGGVTLKNLKNYVNESKIPFIRIMPNTSIANNQGVIALFADNLVSVAQKREVILILNKLAYVCELQKERDLEIVTLLSGCGPALVSKFIEILLNYGIKNKISANLVREIVIRTFLGTITQLNKSKKTPTELIKEVATKGGITEKILNELKNKKFEQIFTEALNVGKKNIQNLQKVLSEESD